MTESRKLSSIFWQHNLQKEYFILKYCYVCSVFLYFSFSSSSIGILFMSADHQNEALWPHDSIYKKCELVLNGLYLSFRKKSMRPKNWAILCNIEKYNLCIVEMSWYSDCINCFFLVYRRMNNIYHKLQKHISFYIVHKNTNIYFNIFRQFHSVKLYQINSKCYYYLLLKLNSKQSRQKQ